MIIFCLGDVKFRLRYLAIYQDADILLRAVVYSARHCRPLDRTLHASRKRELDDRRLLCDRYVLV